MNNKNARYSYFRIYCYCSRDNLFFLFWILFALWYDVLEIVLRIFFLTVFVSGVVVPQSLSPIKRSMNETNWTRHPMASSIKKIQLRKIFMIAFLLFHSRPPSATIASFSWRHSRFILSFIRIRDAGLAEDDDGPTRWYERERPTIRTQRARPTGAS